MCSRRCIESGYGSMTTRKDRLRRAYGVNAHMTVCFGRGDASRRKECDCPPACRKVCKRIEFTDERCPRVHDRGLGRPFTPVANVVLDHWGVNEVPAEVKLTYLFLVSRTRPNSRWVRQPLRLLAAKRGVALKTLREHLGRLQKRGLILIMRMSQVSSYEPGPRYTVVVLDLPDWLPSDVKVDEVDEVDTADDDDAGGDDDTGGDDGFDDVE